MNKNQALLCNKYFASDMCNFCQVSFLRRCGRLIEGLPTGPFRAHLAWGEAPARYRCPIRLIFRDPRTEQSERERCIRHLVGQNQRRAGQCT